MIGNVKDALTLCRTTFDMTEWDTPDFQNNSLPRGWKFIEEGAYRGAFLKAGVVYKYEYSRESTRHRPNLEEWLAYKDLMSFVHPFISIPQTHYFEEFNIIAMEYIKGKDIFDAFDFDRAGQWMEEIAEVAGALGYMDWDNPGNIKYYQRRFWIIDYAM